MERDGHADPGERNAIILVAGVIGVGPCAEGDDIGITPFGAPPPHPCAIEAWFLSRGSGEGFCDAFGPDDGEGEVIACEFTGGAASGASSGAAGGAGGVRGHGCEQGEADG